MDPNETIQPADAPEAVQQDQQTQTEAPKESAAPAEDLAEGTLRAMLGESAPAEEAKPAEPVAPAAPDLSKPGTQQAAAPAKPDAAKAEVDAEVAALGLKEKAAARFHELAAKAAEAEQLRVAAERVQQWEERIVATGATPEQFAQSMGYLTLLNSGDPANIERAFQMIEGEYHALARALGKPVGDAYDPLADHPDLAAKVANMDMDRETALEVAGLRAQSKLREASEQTRTRQDDLARSQEQGRRELAELEQELRSADPAGYQSRLQALTPALQEAVRTLPPNRWAPFARSLFASTPASAPQPIVPQQVVTPMRATVPGGAPVRKVENDADATLAVMLAAKA
jgi:hypothetical protein